MTCLRLPIVVCTVSFLVVSIGCPDDATIDAGVPTPDAGVPARDAGRSDDGGAPGDAGPGSTDAGAVLDGGQAVDGGGGGEDCDVTGFTAAGQDYLTTAIGDFVLIYDAASGPLNKVQLELYGARMPMEVALSGENFADCTVCLSLLSGCDGPQGDCSVHHLAQSGDINIIAYDDTHIAGTLSGIYAVEVTIDAGTLMSTVVDGGQGWCLEALTFDIPVSD